MAFSFETDNSNSKIESPAAGADLHSQVMSGPPARDAAPQKIVVQLEITQPSAPPEPDHIKVHHNAFSVAVHGIGHFGKQYALGLRDSIEPRNLGRETLPVGIGVGTQVIVAHQLAMGIKGGFNQLGQAESQLGAGALISGHLAKTAVSVREVAAPSPQLAAGAPTEAMISLPVTAAPAAGVDLASVAVAGVAPDVLSGAIAGRATTNHDGMEIAQANINHLGSSQAIADQTTTLAQSNATLDAPNVGIDSHGFAVPMTPKQMEKATAYQDSVDQSETQLKQASDAFQAQLRAVSSTMGYSPYATAFVNDLQMRYKYAMTDDQNDDHKAARAYLSDCKQDTDNLKRLAKSDNNPYAVIQLDALKQTVNRLDDIEKHFHKRPSVVLANIAEQPSNS